MATTRYIDIKVRSSKAESKVDKLDGKMKGLGRTADETTKLFGQLSKVAAGVFSALALGQITKYADAFTSVQNQLRQTTKTTEELTQRTQDLLEVSNRSRAGISETAELYTQLTLSTESLNLSTEDLLRLTETITKSFAVSGKTAAESAGAIRQLGQALASGALRGDEFNSIAEGAPEILRALQRELGKSAGELRKFAATGGITAEVLIDALGGAADVIDGKLNKSVATFAQNATIATNNLTKFVGESSTVQNVIGGAGEALVLASESLDNIANTAVVLSSVFIARLIPSATLYTKEVVANTAAQLTQTKAVTGVSAALGVQAAAVTRSTIALRGLTLAGRAASASIAFLGGPVGVALIAAAALVAFSDSIQSVGDSASTSSEELDEFTKSISGLTRATKAKLLSDLNKEMSELRNEITSTTKSLESAENAAVNASKSGSGFSFLSGRAEALRKKVKELNQELTLLSNKQGAIVGAPDLSGGTDRGNINDEVAENKEPSESNFAKKLRRETEQLKVELALQKAVRDGFIDQETADLSAAFIQQQTNKQSALDIELAKLGEDETAKAELRNLFKEQQLLEEQEFQNNLTEIEIQAATERANAQVDANNLVVASKQASQNALLGLISTFASKSKAAAIALIAIEKGLAISNAWSGALAGSVKVYGELPYPAAVAASSKILAQGKLTTALIAAQGFAQAGSISGGASVSTSQSIGGNAFINNGPTSDAQVQQQFVAVENTQLTDLTNELRNRDPEEPLTVDFTRRIIAAVTDAQTSGQA